MTERRLANSFVGQTETPLVLRREAVLRDPSGNRIQLYYAGENRRHPPWRVKRGADRPDPGERIVRVRPE